MFTLDYFRLWCLDLHVRQVALKSSLFAHVCCCRTSLCQSAHSMQSVVYWPPRYVSARACNGSAQPISQYAPSSRPAVHAARRPDVRDRRQTDVRQIDVRQHHRLMPLGRGHNNNTCTESNEAWSGAKLYEYCSSWSESVKRWLQLRFDFDSTATRPRYDHSMTYLTTVGLSVCGLLVQTGAVLMEAWGAATPIQNSGPCGPQMKFTTPIF